MQPLRADTERTIPADRAIEAVQDELARHGLRAELNGCGPEDFTVYRCSVRDATGAVVARSAGKGRGPQAEASALFESWEHYWGERGLAEAACDPARARVIPVAEVIAQPALAGDTMLQRLAADFPTAKVGCLRFDPVDAGSVHPPLWYPVFPRNPACRRYPVPGDGFEYHPYLRYATNSGTASGFEESDATLHALLETIERDAFSFALLDWYATNPPVARAVDPADLPADVAELFHRSAVIFDDLPVLFDITTDIDVPVYCALPPHDLFPQPNWPGAGAALNRAYAAERAIAELVQCTFTGNDPEEVLRHRKMVSQVERWPLIARSAILDPAVPAKAAVAARRMAPAEWEASYGDVPAQLTEVLARLAAHGLHAYRFRWNPGAGLPVVCLVVPGLETFFLAHNGIPVLPTGRATQRLLPEESIQRR